MTHSSSSSRRRRVTQERNTNQRRTAKKTKKNDSASKILSLPNQPYHHQHHAGAAWTPTQCMAWFFVIAQSCRAWPKRDSFWLGKFTLFFIVSALVPYPTKNGTVCGLGTNMPRTQVSIQHLNVELTIGWERGESGVAWRGVAWRVLVPMQRSCSKCFLFFQSSLFHQPIFSFNCWMRGTGSFVRSFVPLLDHSPFIPSVVS
jgi:hypothetical protein